MNDANAPTIISFGEILYDVFPDGARLGGAPLNLAVHLHRLGANAVMVSAVGDDSAGRSAISELRRQGLPVDYVAILPDHPTGRVDIVLDAKKVPSYRFLSDCAYDAVSLPEKPLPRADAFCFGSLAQRGCASRRTLRRLLDEIAQDSTIFFDANLRQDFYSKEILEESLLAADILKLNEEELQVIAKLFGISADCASLADAFNLDVVIRTLGARGCEVLRGDERIAVPAVPVRVVSTVGAGDAFSAAFLRRILSGATLQDAAEAGARLASEVATRLGAF